MTKSDFNSVRPGDYVLAGWNTKVRGQRLLMREKYPDSGRFLDSAVNEHIIYHRNIKLLPREEVV